MVRRRIRRDSLPGGDVRGAYAAALRARWADAPAWGYFGRVVDRLEAGEPVVVPGWAVSQWVPARPWQFLRLEANGDVVPVEPVKVGRQRIEWKAA